MTGGTPIAGLRLAVGGDDALRQVARSRLGPFWAELSEADGTALLRPHETEGPPPGTDAITMVDGTVLGWYRWVPEGIEVFVDSPVAIEGGLRLLASRLLPTDRFLMVHGTALRIGGRAVVALGVSGAGKSTLTTLFTEAESMSDETIVLEASNPPRVHATFVRSSCPLPPVPGDAEIVALLGLEKTPAPALRPLAATDAVRLLLSQTFATPEAALADHLDVATRLAISVPRYTLEFAKDRSFVPLLTELLNR